MNEIFREWLIDIIEEQSLDLEDMNKIIENEEEARGLMKDYFTMNYYEILLWIQEEIIFLNKTLEGDN